jgi:hypothetical protein
MRGTLLLRSPEVKLERASKNKHYYAELAKKNPPKLAVVYVQDCVYWSHIKFYCFTKELKILDNTSITMLYLYC